MIGVIKWCHPKMVTPGAGRPPLATPLLLIFHSIAPTKDSYFEVSDDFIACDLGSPNQNPGYAYDPPIGLSLTIEASHRPFNC